MQEYSLGTVTTDFSNCKHEQFASCGSYIRKRDNKRIYVKRCSLCHANFVIGADSRSEKRCAAIRELMAGKPISGLSVSGAVGRKMAALLKDKRPLCGCGKPAHGGGCSFRARKMWETRRALEQNGKA